MAGVDAPAQAGPAQPGQPPLLQALQLLLPFALGYYLSFFFRSINAVIAPRLVEEVGLSAAGLGLLTASYFVSFALFQLPLGLLLDRFGPRRVQAMLLTAAAGGAVVFALGRDELTLIVGRAMIGLGVAGSLMSAMTAIVLWFPRDRVALVNALFLVSGGLGGLSATRPLEALLAFTDWRMIFLGLAAATALTSALIFVLVPDRTVGGGVTTLRRQVTQLREIYTDAEFWRIAPACALQTGAVFAVLGLWSAYWLTDVERLPRPAVVDTLLWMAIAFTVGTLTIGVAADWIQRRRVELERALGIGLLLFLAIEAALVLRWLPARAALLAFAFLGNLASLAYAILPRRFPAGYAGRVLTALNIVTLACAFSLQWVMGLLLDLWPRGVDGSYPVAAYQAAFGVVLGLNLLTTAWYLTARRRHLPS